jgi:hypothetical protein
MVDLSSKKLLNMSDINSATPEFSALVNSLGLGTNASRTQILNAVRAKFGKPNTMFQSQELGRLAKEAGYDGIISDVAGDAGIDSFSQVMLFDDAFERQPREGVAFKEERTYNEARSKKIADAARRIVKEREIQFTREQNAQVDVQRKWEEEAARRAAGERKAEAQAQKDAYDAAARQRTIDNEAGKKFKLPSEQLSLAERYYLGENVKLNKALADIDKTAPGLVNLQKMLQTPMTELGVEVRSVGMVEAGLPIYRKAFMFNKRSLSKVPLDVAAARGALPEVADALSLGRAKADFQAGQEYMLSNAMGQIIVSNLRRVQGQTPVRYFTVYSAGMKTKIAETQDFRAAMEAMLSEAYRLNSEELMRQTQISTQAVVGLAKKVEEKAKKREPLAPSVIQRYR